MQFLHALEQQFHISHLFKQNRKSVKHPTIKMGFFATCVGTIASDHGCMVVRRFIPP